MHKHEVSTHFFVFLINQPITEYLLKVLKLYFETWQIFINILAVCNYQMNLSIRFDLKNRISLKFWVVLLLLVSCVLISFERRWELMMVVTSPSRQVNNRINTTERINNTVRLAGPLTGSWYPDILNSVL